MLLQECDGKQVIEKGPMERFYRSAWGALTHLPIIHHSAPVYRTGIRHPGKENAPKYPVPKVVCVSERAHQERLEGSTVHTRTSEKRELIAKEHRTKKSSIT